MKEATYIRKAMQEDIATIEHMICALCNFHGEDYVPDPDALYRDLFGPEKGTEAFFAVRDGKEIAFSLVFWHFSVHRQLKRRLIVHLFYVDDDYRRTGVGRQMMTYLEDFACTYGANELLVSADLHNEPAQQAYLAMGYKRRVIGGAHFQKTINTQSPRAN